MQLPFFFGELTDDRVKKTIDVKGVSKILTLSILKLLCFFRVSTNSKKPRITVAKSLTTSFEELLVFIKVQRLNMFSRKSYYYLILPTKQSFWLIYTTSN